MRSSSLGKMREGSLKEKVEEIRGLLRESGLFGENPCPYTIGFDMDTRLDLFISKTIKYAVNDDAFVAGWIDEQLKSTRLNSELVPLDRVDKWHIDEETGNIVHESGRFFTITGLKVRHRWKFREIEWDQPIIDQPEIGILGLLAKKINGVLHFCLNAKEEPGNINLMQLAPTVQATYSNYTQVHGGELPPFINLFLDPPKDRVLFSRLQTQDGGRFLFKSNKNMIVMMGEDEPDGLPEGFVWLTLRQIGDLMKRDNLVNFCARSVLSCLI